MFTYTEAAAACSLDLAEEPPPASGVQGTGELLATQVTYTWRGLEVDVSLQRVTVDGAWVPLRRIELKLLAVLVSSSGRLLGRADLLRTVWGDDWTIKCRTVDAYVRRLRARLGPYRDALETIHGYGYRWREHGDEALPELQRAQCT